MFLLECAVFVFTPPQFFLITPVAARTHLPTTFFFTHLSPLIPPSSSPHSPSRLSPLMSDGNFSTFGARGPRLTQVDAALAALEQDLHGQRRRFSHPPPPHSQAGTTTRSETPEPPDDEQERRDAHRIKLLEERGASRPWNQFEADVAEKAEQLRRAESHGTCDKFVDAALYDKRAREMVREAWREEDIYDEDWPSKRNPWLWPHEQPIEPDSESEASPPHRIFETPSSRPHSKSEDEKRLIAERRLIRERHRDASRPFYRFVYQMSRERERLLAESTNGEATITAANINTTAYENVVKTWKRRKLWNDSWGVMPGMLWMHEEPFVEEATNIPAPVQTNQPENSNHGTAEADHPQAFGIMNTSQQNLFTGHGSIVLGNGKVDQAPSAQNSSRQRRNGRVPSATKQTPRRNKRTPSHQDVQVQPLSSTVLGPVHESKISKRTKKPTLQPSSSKSLPQTDSTPLRRSKRLRSPQPGKAEDSNASVPTDSQKGAARSKLKRTAPGNSNRASSGKPKGISKEHLQRPGGTRAKARRNIG